MNLGLLDSSDATNFNADVARRQAGGLTLAQAQLCALRQLADGNGVPVVQIHLDAIAAGLVAASTLNFTSGS